MNQIKPKRFIKIAFITTLQQWFPSNFNYKNDAGKNLNKKAKQKKK